MERLRKLLGIGNNKSDIKENIDPSSTHNETPMRGSYKFVGLEPMESIDKKGRKHTVNRIVTKFDPSDTSIQDEMYEGYINCAPNEEIRTARKELIAQLKGEKPITNIPELGLNHRE